MPSRLLRPAHQASLSLTLLIRATLLAGLLLALSSVAGAQPVVFEETFGELDDMGDPPPFPAGWLLFDEDDNALHPNVLQFTDAWDRNG